MHLEKQPDRASLHRRAIVPALAALLALGGVSAAAPETADPPRVIRDAQQSPPVTPFVFEGDVRDLPRVRAWQPGDPIREIPMRSYRQPGSEPLPTGVQGLDPLLAIQQEALATSWPSFDVFATPSRNFPGQGFTGVVPPDPVGDVGPDHYIQMVNGYIGAVARIHDKAAPVPNELATFFLDDMGTSLCSSGMGDPIVLYDRQADRWLISEFSGAGLALCVYVSRTADPVTGGWYAYAFTTPKFPDYPKYAVWATDANGGDGSYVVTTNEDDPGVYALDRGAMLAGRRARFQLITMPPLPGFTLQGPAPAEPDGPHAPPANAPAIVMRQRDTEIHDGPEAPADLLEMWLFDVDWEDPDNTTLTQVAGIDVAEFDSTVCGLAYEGCFAQPGSVHTLMPIREYIMNRLQYYNHGGFESLVGNFVVDVDGADHGGIRWFELQRPAGGEWALHQEGVYAVDEDHRWLGALAMDQAGNIALGHNVVSAETYPSLRYTGRMADDAHGWMTQPETEVHGGTAANNVYRWGDYAAMSLDPSDDCTFWFTGMDNTSKDWRTQIASFRFGNCGCESVPPMPALEATVTTDNQIDLFWEDADDASVVEYLVQRSRVAGGPYETIALVPDSSPGFAGGPGYAFEDADLSGMITYYYVIVARDAAGCRSRPFNEVQATATGPCTLGPVFGGLRSAASANLETCAVDLAWDPAQPECGGPVVYNVYRSEVPGFTPGPDNLLLGGLADTAARDYDALVVSTPYYYVVRAVDLATGVEEGNLVEREAVPAGPYTGTNVLFYEDFEAPDSFEAWTVINGPDHVCGAWRRDDLDGPRPWTSEGFYALSYSAGCTERPPYTDTTLVSPAIDVSLEGIVSVTLSHAILYQYDSKDVAAIEAWDGSAWQLVFTLPQINLGGGVTRDVTAYAAGNPAFRFRFRYENRTDDTFWSVDEVALKAEAFNTCTTGTAP